MASNLMEAYCNMGHFAHLFDWTQWLYRSKKYTLKNRILDRLLFHRVAKTINDNLMSTINNGRCDLFIVLKGIHLFPETIAASKNRVGYVVNWNPDDFFNPLNNSRYLLESFSEYDCIFTPRRHLQEEYRRKGAKRVEILNWYYLPKYQHPVEVSLEERKKYGSDLVFIGTWSRRRERFIGRLKGLDIRVWGSHWHRAQKRFRRRIDCRSPVYAEEMCKVICSSKVNINILSVENRDTTNVRNFEIAACKGFQLSERSPAILTLFEEGKEIACYTTPEELVSQCNYFLKHEAERERIRLQGFERVVNGRHTMADKAENILSALYHPNENR